MVILSGTIVLKMYHRTGPKKIYIHCVKDLPYENMLFILNLPSLEYRRFIGGMIQVYKIVRNCYDELSVKNLLIVD